MVKQEVRTETEFLGRPYNFADWRPTDAERAYFQAEGPKVGQMAPDFTLPSLDGEELTLSSLRGKPVMIEFGSIT